MNYLNSVADSIKNTANNVKMGVSKATGMVVPPTQSQFREKGTLTPEEFVKAGDQLQANCGSWKWYAAIDAKFSTKFLPADKQFIGIENIISKQRVRDLLSGCELFVKEGEDDDILITKKEEEPKQMQQIDQASKDRFYNLYIVYDLYYFTPRLFFTGRDEEQRPLTYEQVKEDIMSEYADKTVTNEYHPHLNMYMSTIHPCKHADTLKFLTDQMVENGADQTRIHADNSILIFLKFMGSVIPTIEFDFVSEIVIG